MLCFGIFLLGLREGERKQAVCVCAHMLYHVIHEPCGLVRGVLCVMCAHTQLLHTRGHIRKLISLLAFRSQACDGGNEGRVHMEEALCG